MALNAGARLGPYEIVALIGAGGMGEVYRARDPRLDRDVAIKVLSGAFSADPEPLRRFELEARAAAALNHPNILAVHDIGTHEHVPYIVSEILDGTTLRAAIGSAAGSGVVVRKAIDYAIQIARGLAAAHEKGITHRDLKPDNVFVTAAGHVKILDFGLAKLTEVVPAMAGLSQAQTVTPASEPGMILGTIGYMAPEQVRAQAVDHRADIFAFGAILYEMLSGHRAFGGGTAADTMTAILERDPPDLPLAERKIPPGLARIVDRCLEKNATARFQTAADLAFALEGLSSSSASSAAEVSVSGDRGLLRSARQAWLVAGLSCVATLLVGVPAAIYLRPAAPESLITRLDVVTPPTTDAFSFALSPDGRQLVFVANGEKGSQLWLRPLDQATAQPLAGTEGANYPFWAPDSRALGFFADGRLKRLDLSGGAPQVLANAPSGRGGTWNADGAIVFAPTNSGGLTRVSATGGTPTTVTTLGSGQGSHRWPQFLADGRRFLFFVALGQVQTRGVYVASLDSGEPVRVLTAETAAFTASGLLLRVAQGVLVAQSFDPDEASIAGEPLPVAQAVGADTVLYQGAFSVSTNVLAHRGGASAARRQLVWVDRAGKVVGVLGPPDDNALASPSLAPDGQRVAVGRNIQGNGDVWLMDVSRGVASRFTFDENVEASPVWSPDGSRVVFRSGRNGFYDLFEKPASGAGEEQPLLVTPQNKSPLDWSRDGRVLLYATQDDKTGSDLWALPMIGDRKPFAVVQTNFDEMQGQFSPDGRWLAYASNESGRYEVYVRPYPDAGGKWQVSTGGGSQPRWGRNGQELVYVAPDARLMVAPIRVVQGAIDAGTPAVLFPTRLATGSNVLAAGYNSSAQYAVAPDGRFLLNVSVDDAVTSPITIVLNWAAGLQK
jgi:Tol biopolymer transport system component